MCAFRVRFLNEPSTWATKYYAYPCICTFPVRLVYTTPPWAFLVHHLKLYVLCAPRVPSMYALLLYVTFVYVVLISMFLSAPFQLGYYLPFWQALFVRLLNTPSPCKLLLYLLCAPWITLLCALLTRYLRGLSVFAFPMRNFCIAIYCASRMPTLTCDALLANSRWRTQMVHRILP